jgi:hypothetical protein
VNVLRTQICYTEDEGVTCKILAVPEGVVVERVEKLGSIAAPPTREKLARGAKDVSVLQPPAVSV